MLDKNICVVRKKILLDKGLALPSLMCGKFVVHLVAQQIRDKP